MCFGCLGNPPGGGRRREKEKDRTHVRHRPGVWIPPSERSEKPEKKELSAILVILAMVAVIAAIVVAACWSL